MICLSGFGVGLCRVGVFLGFRFWYGWFATFAVVLVLIGVCG